MRKSDDEAALEMGRGLVFIKDGVIAYVAYDEPVSRDAHASIWCIDEYATVPATERTITSRDINGFDVDIESPMPDTLGGFYFVAESGDLNASLASKDIASKIYHYTPSGQLIAMVNDNMTSNGELVIAQGVHKGSIFTYTNLDVKGLSMDNWLPENSVEVIFWDGYQTQMNVFLYETAVEIEKPFTAGNGFYFSMESKNKNIRDEKDSVYFWPGTLGAFSVNVWSSDNELEVEEPPLDGNNGFYFVNVDLTSTDAKTLISTMTLLHARTTGSTRVCDLGSFLAPPSTFIKNPKDP